MCSILVGKVKDEDIFLNNEISQSTVCNKREDQNTQIETKTAIDKMRYVEFSFINT